MLLFYFTFCAGGKLKKNEQKRSKMGFKKHLACTIKLQ